MYITLRMGPLYKMYVAALGLKYGRFRATIRSETVPRLLSSME
jgi:hypothetical protein